MSGPTTENCAKKKIRTAVCNAYFFSAAILQTYISNYIVQKNGYLAGQWSPRLFHCECLTLSGDCLLRQSHLQQLSSILWQVPRKVIPTQVVLKNLFSLELFRTTVERVGQSYCQIYSRLWSSFFSSMASTYVLYLYKKIDTFCQFLL